MSTPRYFHYYDLPDFDLRYGCEAAFTDRCAAVATELYGLLQSEVRFLRQVPADCLTANAWDLCHCAGVVVDSIPRDSWSVEESCRAEAPQLYKLAWRFHEHGLCGRIVQARLETLFAHVARGGPLEDEGECKVIGIFARCAGR